MNMLCSDEVKNKLEEAFKNMDHVDLHTFNASILCCLTKEPSGHDSEKGEHYEPSATRPLNKCNVDNALLASAGRVAWEQFSRNSFLKCREAFCDTGSCCIMSSISIMQP